jgi:immune inhibitor A
VVGNGQNKTVTLGSAANPEGPLAQAVVVPLPTQTIVTQYNTPHSGTWEWWGGSADDLNVSMTRDVSLTGATSAKITTQAWYDIEEGYDFLYGEVSTDNGATWTKIGTEVDGISGGGEEPVWTELSYNLDAYAGQNVKFRFRYQTDGGVHYAGPFLDDIALVTNGTGWVDDVEAGTGAWTANGFTRMTGSTSRTAEHFYMAEFRSYTGYDKNFKTGPYNFTSASAVEKFPYQDGMLVWYVNYAFSDNNTIAHRGGGLALPVDARPAPITYSDGTIIGNRRQPFDATFGTQKTDAVTFHKANGATAVVPSGPAIRVFDDSDPNRYYSTGNPLGSVKVAGDGVKITVLLENSVLVPFMIVQVKN